VFSAKSVVVPDIEIVQVITPSITPYYHNNPGFGILEIDDSDLEIESFEFYFMQLEDYHRFKIISFDTYNPAKLGDFDLNDASSIRKF